MQVKLSQVARKYDKKLQKYFGEIYFLTYNDLFGDTRYQVKI